MRMTVRDMQEMKDTGQKVPVLTAYDYAWAKLLEAAGVRFMLVGDSLGQCVLGYETTVPVTMEDMLHHVKSVVRGTQFAHVIADMPFMSYQVDESDALRNAGRLLAVGGAQSVKLEGGRRVASTVRRITEAGVPVMGHIGLTPQSINQLGRPTVQGNSAEAAGALLEDAVALQDAGAYSIVLESVPARLAKAHHRQADGPDHRHRRGPPLRWPGPGLPRHPGPPRRRHTHRPRPETRPPLRSAQRHHHIRRVPVRRGHPRGTVPIRRGELQDEARPPRRDHRTVRRPTPSPSVRPLHNRRSRAEPALYADTGATLA